MALKRQPHQPQMIPPETEVEKNLTMRPECLEFDPTPRNQPRRSGWSTTVRTVLIARGVDTVSEAEVPRDLIRQGRMTIGSSAKDECRPLA